MQITKLKLKGFLGIKKGLGLDEIELDFAGLSGLVAFSGPNGHGKTSILDNCHPYRALASRSGALQNHCFLRDSSKELSFIHQGDTYRTLVKVDAQFGKQEGFIWKNDEPQVDGKVKNYDQYIENLFGSPALFFNSVFAAQGGQKLSDLTTGELKKLFSEFLRLDKLIEYEETAKAAANLLAGNIQTVTRDIDRVTDTVNELTKSADQYSKKAVECEIIKSEIDRTTGCLRDVEKEVATLRDQAAAENATKKRIADMKAEADRIEAEITVECNRNEQQLFVINKKLARTRLEFDFENKLFAEKDSIIKAEKQTVEAEERLSQVRTQLTTARQEQAAAQTDAKYYALEHLKHINMLERLDSNPDIAQLEQEIIVSKRDSADLARRDPACQSSTCSFIVRALAAKDSLPGLEGKLSELKDRIAKEAAEITGITLELGRQKSTAGAKLKEMSDQVFQLEKEERHLGGLIAALKSTADKAPRLRMAERNIAKLHSEVTEIEAEISRTTNDHQRTKTEKTDRLSGITRKIEALASSLGDVAQKLAKAESNAEMFRQAIESKQKFLTDLLVEKAAIERDIKSLDTAKKEVAGLQTQKIAMTNEQAEWRYLQHACSKDGLRALEIDSVAPSISGYANDILAKTFGPSQSVRFITQDPETGSEVLDIMVIREDGTETPLENLSGGEKVWSLKALRLAMTLIAKERSGRSFTSSMADEEDGQLDAENAQNFIRMYQAFMSSGGFNTCFFISHRPECVAMADHVVRFSKGEVTVQ
ncbi:MAG: AAA family ATPase [Desulfobacterales bacterium]|jgi:exonuclease SbcC|nr:AAA family ATPase [Desulfobacterales bacterium]